jgi:two-component system phosphate regulon sensor histidine kinase PhoR
VPFRFFNPWVHLALQLGGLGLLVVLVLALAQQQDWLWPVISLVLLVLLLGHTLNLYRLLRWLAGSADAPLPEGGGSWDWVYAGLHQRVRQRQAQQKSLSEALERFRRMIQALPDGIIIFNRHTQIEWVNGQAERQFDLRDATDHGLSLTALIRQPEFVRYLQQGDYGEPLLFRNPRKKGQTLLLQVMPYGEDENLLLARDISQQEQLDMMRRDFVANVSHELKTPLTVVSGFAEMLYDHEGEYDPALTRHYLGLIGEQSLRMRRMIEDLLTLSSLESNLRLEEELLDIRQMLEEVLEEAQALSADKHVVTLEIEGPTQFWGCPRELHSVFANLASNAVRYTPAGGEIRLHWQALPGQKVEYRVTDTGIGIASEHLPRLTERFYRVDRSRSRETGGTGLGLAIVKHILSRHQGRLEVQSQPGKGSVFTACFPASRIR